MDKSNIVQNNLSKGWIKSTTYIPTGNFLEDIFRHKDLTYNDRVNIWASLIGDKLPCIWIADLKFKEPVYIKLYIDYTYGNTGDDYAVDLQEFFELGDIPDNKPIYFYCSTYLSLENEESEPEINGNPIGLLVNHLGLFVISENEDEDSDDEEIGFVWWDNIVRIKNLKEEKLCYKIVIDTDSEEEIVLMFPKPGIVAGMTYPDKAELELLIKLMKIRIKQIKPFKNEPFLIEDPEWYFTLNERVARDLSQDYLNKKINDNSKKLNSAEKKIEITDEPQSKILEQNYTNNIKKSELPDKIKFKAVPCSGSTPTNPATYLEFWQILKPYLDKLNHKEFSKVKLKENDCLDTNPNIVVGVYYSILVRKSKKLIRLEAYIATETEIGNLQIIDYIKSHIKEPNILKGKIEYDRKEGRIAQKVSVSLNGFEFEDRNCWENYAQQLVSIIDPFMDAVDTCLKSLI